MPGRNKKTKPRKTALQNAPSGSQTYPIILPNISTPVDINIQNITSVLSILATGSEEALRTFTSECDVIFECRMCKTIFRVLTNFLIHKAKDCQDSPIQEDQTNCVNDSQEMEFDVIPNADDAPIEDPLKQNFEDNLLVQQESEIQINIPVIAIPSSSSDYVQTMSNNDKDKCFDKIEETKFDKSQNTDKPVEKTIEQNVDENLLVQPESDLNLTRASANPAKQTSSDNLIVKEEQFVDNSKDSNKGAIPIDKALKVINNANAAAFHIFCENLKAERNKMNQSIQENSHPEFRSGDQTITETTKKTFVCSVCDRKYLSMKSLIWHTKCKHKDIKVLFGCPECNDKFLSTRDVIKHLFRKHLKTLAEMQQLKNKIRCIKFRKDQLQEQPNRNLRTAIGQRIGLQTKLETKNQQRRALSKTDNILPKCEECSREFKSKGELQRHLRFCYKRLANRNTRKENTTKTIQIKENTTKKVQSKEKTKKNSGDNKENNSKDANQCNSEKRLTNDGIVSDKKRKSHITITCKDSSNSKKANTEDDNLTSDMEIPSTQASSDLTASSSIIPEEEKYIYWHPANSPLPKGITEVIFGNDINFVYKIKLTESSKDQETIEPEQTNQINAGVSGRADFTQVSNNALQDALRSSEYLPFVPVKLEYDSDSVTSGEINQDFNMDSEDISIKLEPGDST